MRKRIVFATFFILSMAGCTPVLVGAAVGGTSLIAATQDTKNANATEDYKLRIAKMGCSSLRREYAAVGREKPTFIGGLLQSQAAKRNYVLRELKRKNCRLPA